MIGRVGLLLMAISSLIFYVIYLDAKKGSDINYNILVIAFLLMIFGLIFFRYGVKRKFRLVK